ncbi:hypothetical protein A2U01_0022770, partial [Trifolium medium]|nr:hypothetical protein [Trifolium medium]
RCELLAKVDQIIVTYKQETKVIEEHNEVLGKLMDKVEDVMEDQNHLIEDMVKLMEKMDNDHLAIFAKAGD